MRRALLAALLLSSATGSAAALATQTSGESIGAGSRPPHYCPRGDTDGFNANRLIGRKLPRARHLANAHGCTVRVVKRNGEGLIITEDFSPTRIDVAVWGNRVTGIDGIY
jgi:hypothetical protein